ncbi:MAG: carotenoid biosynthesis protein [bacterium]
METISLLAGTVLLRPYVFAFLALYLLLGWWQIGWRRIFAWTLTGYGLAFAAEYGSIHWGIPFGDYFYIETTRGQELWIAGVPFMDSLSFTFLTFTGFSCAWPLAAAFRARGWPPALDSARYEEIRRSPAVLVAGAFITTLMDVVIDPVSLMGDRWFLGQIYGYRHQGAYFGVPAANFIGWAVVSAAIIGVNQLADSRLPKEMARALRTPYALLHLGGFALFLFIVGFNLAVTLWLKAHLLFCTSLSLVAGFLLLAAWIFAGGRGKERTLSREKGRKEWAS